MKICSKMGMRNGAVKEISIFLHLSNILLFLLGISPSPHPIFLYFQNLILFHLYFMI